MLDSMVMIREEVQKAVATAAKKAGISDTEIVLDHPADFTHGDFSTNIALSASKKIGVKPRDIAEKIVAEMDSYDWLEKVEIAGAGFINMYLTKDFFTTQTKEIIRAGDGWGRNKTLTGEKVVVEYTDMNPFKAFHIGHLMSNAIGESISRLVAFSNAEVKRANYQGDVGLHVAKCLYLPVTKAWPIDTIEAMGAAYVEGARLYEEDMEAKKEIDALNKKIYEKQDGHIVALYDQGRAISLEYFETIYKILDTKFDFYFFESQTGPVGKTTVESYPEFFEPSDGAVVFHGEKYDPKLHTRVFLNSEGLPTYEAKELGLLEMKRNAWPELTKSIVVTASEIDAYFRVVKKAMELVFPDAAGKVEHISHGMMQLQSGKMSSRKGNIITGESLLQSMREKALEKMQGRELGDEAGPISDAVAVAAIKYAILRQSAGKNIIFDQEKSLSFEGDSGPYLQYAHTRSLSVLRKAESEGVAATTDRRGDDISVIERMLYRFPEVALRAREEYEPHHVATYLSELASAFSTWYASTQIVDSKNPESAYRVALTHAFQITMKNGLWLLGIKAPEKM